MFTLKFYRKNTDHVRCVSTNEFVIEGTPDIVDYDKYVEIPLEGKDDLVFWIAKKAHLKTDFCFDGVYVENSSGKTIEHHFVLNDPEP